MKNYKNLIPILLIALMALSIFSTIKDAANQKAQYESALKAGRKAAEQGIVDDAISNFQIAMELHPSVDTAVELGQVYVEQGWISEAASWGEDVLEQFPEEGKAYIFLMEQYIALGDFEECFELMEMAEAKDIGNKEFAELSSQIEYVYEFETDDFEDVTVFSSGLCAVKEDGLWGYVDVKNKTVIKPQFKWAGVFTTDGIAPVQTVEGEYYYISTNGNKKVIVQNIEDCMGLGASVENVLVAGDKGFYTYYNQNFEKLIEGNYTYATTMNGGIAAVQDGSTWYIIDKEGNKIGEAYDDVIADEKGIVYRNDRIFVEKSGSIIMIDAEGKAIGSEKYEDAKMFLQADGYAAVKKGEKWGFVDKKGKMIIEPQYDDARSFSNGYAAVKKGGKWGFIDVSGKQVLGFGFEDARDFIENGKVFVKINNKWEFLKLIKYNH